MDPIDERKAKDLVQYHALRQRGQEALRGLVLHANLISFQIRIGTMPDGNKLDLVAREIDDRDVPRANLVLGQLRARNLPVPAAVFAERIARVLELTQLNEQAARPPMPAARAVG